MTMIRTSLLASLVLTAGGMAQAATPAREIAAFCSQSWPGNRGVQSFCIKQQDNYYDWVRYLRKHSATNPRLVSHLDQCTAAHQPDYRKVFDCVQDGPSWLPFL